AGLARLLLDRYGAATLPASAFGEYPGALRLRLATGLLCGDTQEQQAAALTAPNPLTTAWIASALTRLDQILADLATWSRPSAPVTGSEVNPGTGPGSRTWTTTTSCGSTELNTGAS